MQELQEEKYNQIKERLKSRNESTQIHGQTAKFTESFKINLAEAASAETGDPISGPQSW
jgi:hypothetical protein